MNRAVVILSGGLDSTTLLYDVISQGHEVFALSVDYGQKHKKELEYASKTCKKLGVNHKIITLNALNDLSPSALTRDDWKVPEGHYEDLNMKQTVVPNRNLILSNFALAYALSLKASKVFLGIHAGDHFIYEDCREQALNSLNENAYVWSSDNRGSLTPSFVRAFFEAEGCFTYFPYKQIRYNRHTRERISMAKHPKIVPKICISQKEKAILEEIKKFFYGRGSITTNKRGCSDYTLQWQDCRLMIDLMKGKFKTKYKEEQFNKWYNKFHEMFEREVEMDNPTVRDKIYYIQTLTFVAPYLDINKIGIVRKGLKLGVDYSLTWTCYKGGEKACGKCGSCQERLEAFKMNNAIDPIVYEVY